MNLVVALEMADQGLGTLTSGPITYNRSKIYLDPADYDGATYYFEVVAAKFTNNDYDIELYDVTNASVKATVAADGDTWNQRRIRSTAFTPAAGKNVYTVTMPDTISLNSILVWSARIIVVQSNATKTRLQFPLVGNIFSDGSNAENTVASSADNRTEITYGQTNPGRHSLWLQEREHLREIASGNPWTLEAVLSNENASTSATLGLFNFTDSAQVGSVEVANSGTTPTLVDTDFADSLMSGHDGDEFEFRLKSGNASYNAFIGRAALYVRLTDLWKAQVYLRCGKAKSDALTVSMDHQRFFVDTDQWSSPTWFYESTGLDASATPQPETTIRAYNGDVGTGGSAIGTELTFGASRDRVRGAATPVDGYNHYAYVTASSDVITLSNVVLLAELASPQIFKGLIVRHKLQG